MSRAKDKGRLPPFVPLHKETLATPAWKAMSMGARMLYVALKGQSSNAGNLAYLSYRKAQSELGIRSFSRVSDWFRELQHYGFIVLHRYGSLGVEGKGKAPQWRLTEKGAAATGELPTGEYLRWDGVLFEPERSPKQRERAATVTTHLAAARRARKSGQPMVNLDMCQTHGTPQDASMYMTHGTPGNGSAADARNTSATDARNGVFPTQVRDSVFSGVTNAGNTWDGDEHELATRFLAALSVRDRSPKD